MRIQCLTVGDLAVNCYLLECGGEVAVIDPGAQAELILEKVKKSGCNLTKILLTHGHFDHTGAVCELAEKTGAKVYIHSNDKIMLMDNDRNLSFLTGEKIKTYSPDVMLDDIKEIPLGDSVIKVYHTPGHSEGSVCYLWEDNLFDGDLLFQGSIGRFDFGDFKTEMQSLKFIMDNFEDSVTVYPGHGAFTTVGDERENNPYIINHVLD